MKAFRFSGFLIAITLLVAQGVSAFLLLTPPRTWTADPTYIVDQNGIATIADADRGATRVVNAVTAAAAWNGAGAGVVVNAVKGNTAGLVLGDGVPMLAFRDPFGACTGNCLAATFTGYFSQHGDGRQHINDADIVTNLNPANLGSWTSEGEDPGGVGCSNEYFIEGVMVHEAGHGLGLGHTGVIGATMYPSVAACTNAPTTTEADDENGLFALYGTAGHTAFNCAWSGDIKESSGIFYSCPAGKVMVGRRHSGDENGNTRYFCCNLGNPAQATTVNLLWSANIQESNGTSYICPGDQVLVGRWHSGDENGNTRYQCANVFNGGVNIPRRPGSCSWTSDIRESNGTFLNCPGNQVLAGRRHSGDENGNTRYYCCNLQ